MTIQIRSKKLKYAKSWSFAVIIKQKKLSKDETLQPSGKTCFEKIR